MQANDVPKSYLTFLAFFLQTVSMMRKADESKNVLILGMWEMRTGWVGEQ